MKTISIPVAEFCEACLDVPAFLACCRACGNYGARWSCPPFEFEPEALWTRYTTLLLCEEKVERPKPPRVAEAKRRMTDELFALEAQHPGSLALSPGMCDICGDDCTRSSGQPCRHPDKMRYSIEALGGNLEKAAVLYFGDPLRWATPDGKLPEYYLLLGGLLIP